MADQNTDGDWAFTIAPIYKPKGGPTEPGDGSDTIRVTPIWKKKKTAPETAPGPVQHPTTRLGTM